MPCAAEGESVVGIKAAALKEARYARAASVRCGRAARRCTPARPISRCGCLPQVTYLYPFRMEVEEIYF
eukprot:6283307-Prymnesium_polylepis.1